MNTVNDRSDARENKRRENFINQWSRAAHAMAVFPGLLIAYGLGSISGGAFSILNYFLLVLFFEATSLIVAWVYLRLTGGRD